MARKYGANQVRIIAGKWRGRRLALPDAKGLRPTGDRVRETLFNWLQAHLPGARCLDLFAGSGVLGLEAASRGAASVVLVENNPRVCRQLRETLASLQAMDAVVLVESEAMAYLSGPARPFDVVFLDPPFAEVDLAAVCSALHVEGWLSAGAKIYVETGADAARLSLPWQLSKEKVQGGVRFALYIND